MLYACFYLGWIFNFSLFVDLYQLKMLQIVFLLKTGISKF